MSEPHNQRYNLVFSGQLLPGTERRRAELTLTAFFGLRDVTAVRGFFSGKPVPLRRNLSRDEALRLYRQLRSVGLICDLHRATGRTAPGSQPPAKSENDAAPADAAPDRPVRGKPRSRPNQAALQVDDGRYMDIRSAPAAEVSNAAEAPQRHRSALSRAPAPNLFALRPGTAPGDPGSVVERLQTRALIAGAAAAVLCVAVLAITLRFPAAPPGAEPRGPLAVTSHASGELLLLTDQALLIHARSGLARARVSAKALGVASFAPPLLALSDGRVLLGARLPEDGTPLLLRCMTAVPSCERFLLLDAQRLPVAVAESFLGDALFVYDAGGRLARYDMDGGLQAERSLSETLNRPRLLYHQGLLLIPGADTPLLGVYRPDRESLGEQLDALFLASPDAPTANQLRDIALAGDDRYALLAADDGSTALLHFDADWGAGRTLAPATAPTADAYLTVWRDRVLLADDASAIVQRIAPGGSPEASFASTLLREERDEWLRLTRQRQLLQSAGLTLPLFLALFAAAAATLFFTAARVLGGEPAARTALLDPMPAGIEWTPAAPGRAASLRRAGLLSLATAVLPAAVLLFRAEISGAMCLVPAVLGALYAASALRRGSGGHFGRRGDEVVLVDYDGRYFYGRCRSVVRGAGFLFAGQVALPLNALTLDNLQAPDVEGIRPDRGADSVIGRLWLLRHPWLAALLALLAGWLASAALFLIS